MYGHNRQRHEHQFGVASMNNTQMHSIQSPRRNDNLMSIQMNIESTVSADAKLHHRKRRVRSLLLAAGIVYIVVIFLDGVAQLAFFNGQSSALEGRVEMKPNIVGGGEGRQLVGSELAPEREIQLEENSINAVPADLNQAQLISSVNNARIQQTQPRRRNLHRLPLLPKHALQNRQRRDLFHAQKPLPQHLRHDHEDEQYHSSPDKRRRIYPIMEGELNTVVDRMHRRQSHKQHGRGKKNRRTQETQDLVEAATLYETGSLYQGYGTHYLDLWIGTPPQRQTVILDTGSSVTAFPCAGCKECGRDGKVQYHLDEVYDQDSSATYREEGCMDQVNGCNIGTCSQDANDAKYCKLAVAYAEGSTWTASEGSDVVYPAGPHEVALENAEERMENGVGVGMGDLGGQVEFDWMDFRLEFGCQTKVTGLFQTQLEDGIMGMDNRKGAFWLQLQQHYKNSGYVQDPNDPFDPAQFSLCYDRQPMSSNLVEGVGSGSLTIGGSDPLLHGTPMVFAENLTPKEGWYSVKIKGMFLRTNGGTLGEPHPNANEVKYIRVDAEEKDLNGNLEDGQCPIVDSGTTDTYLSASLKEPFTRAWKTALANDNAQYTNEAVYMTLDQVKALPTVLIVLRGHVSNSIHETNPPVGMVSHPTNSPLLTTTPSDTTLNSISPTDVIIAIPPEHYMEASSKEENKFTSRLYFTESYGDRSILGANFIMGHEVLFDNTAGRMGFSESHCDYERYIRDKEGVLEELIGKMGEESVGLGEQEQHPVVSDVPAAAETVDAGAVGGAGQSNEAPTQGNADAAGLESTEDSTLTASGWSRKMVEDGGLRRDVRLPG